MYKRHEDVVSKTQDLSWACLDERISDQQFQRLQDLLREQDAARQTYAKCVQLDLDLHHFFRGGRAMPQLDLPGLMGSLAPGNLSCLQGEAGVANPS